VKIEQYYFEKGGFSEIYRGQWVNPETGEVTRVAIKLFSGIHTDPEVLARVTQRLRRETRVWLNLSDPNVVPFLGLCNGLGPSFAMISPLYDNGDVISILPKTHWQIVWQSILVLRRVSDIYIQSE